MAGQESDTDICGICHEDLENHRVYPTYSLSNTPHSCRLHVFHFPCLAKWHECSDYETALCPICKREFNTWICMSDPIHQLLERSEERKRQATVGKYLCAGCGKKFKSASGRFKCEQKHTEEFKCKKCGNKFTQQYSLKRHMAAMHSKKGRQK